MAVNLPGKSTWELVRIRKIRRRIVGVTALGMLFWLYSNGFKFHSLTGWLVTGLAMWGLYSLVEPIMDKLLRREGQAARGAKAEECVGDLLKSLSADDHMVLHDVRSKYGNIDHLVLRKDGAIILLETKSHGGEVTEVSGELRVNGKSEKFIEQTHRNIYWLRDVLKQHLGVKPWISAAIVFTNADVSVCRQLRGVSVINAGYLTAWMSNRPNQTLVSAKLWSNRELFAQELRQKTQPSSSGQTVSIRQHYPIRAQGEKPVHQSVGT